MLKYTVLFFIIFSLTMFSCSKKHFPAVSENLNPAFADNEMMAFLKEGAERKLDTRRKKPKKIIRTAEEYIGTPHCMGGTTSKCMDCSGLTFVSFKKNNIEIPRKSQEQARYGQIIYNPDNLKRGDLVFFTKSYSSSDYITHVGIYLGGNKFIHASTSNGVIITPLDNPWWSQRFVFGTRVF